MDIFANFQPFFFNFFLRLKKETGMELDSAQYEDFLTCWLTYKITDKEDLYRLCETIFLTRSEFRPAFIRIFDEHFAMFENISVEDSTNQKEKIDDRKPEPSLNDTKPEQISDKDERVIPESPSPPDTTDLFDKTTPDPQPELQFIDTSDWSEINLTIKNGSNGKGSEEDAQKENYKPSKFIFLPEKTLPFDVRKTTQTWRKVATHFTQKPTDQLNTRALIQQLMEDGFIHRLVYETEKTENQQIVWLSDHEGSMNPFTAWENSLLRAITNTPPTVSVKEHTDRFNRYYFHDYPTQLTEKNDFQLFANRSHTEVVSWTKARSEKKWNKHTLVVVYSDAAAAHRKLDFDRVKVFYDLCTLIRKTTSRLLWINPVLQTDESAAQYIGYFVEMVYPDDVAFKRYTSRLPALSVSEREMMAEPVNVQDTEKKIIWPLPDLLKYVSEDSISEIRIEAFMEVCPTGAHTWLACHAAFPVALTTDLLQQIWLNFQTNEAGYSYPIPLSTVDEVLHSPLVREIGRDLYEIYPAIRQILLKGLRDGWGPEREWRVATFMEKYLEERRNEVPTRALAAAEKVNFKTQTLTSDELAKELNSLMVKTQDTANYSQWLEAKSQIEYLLSISSSRSVGPEVISLADPLKGLHTLSEGMRLAQQGKDREDALKAFHDALPFLEQSQADEGFKVKLPLEVQKELLLRNVEAEVADETVKTKGNTFGTPVIFSYFAQNPHQQYLKYLEEEYRLIERAWIQHHNHNLESYYEVRYVTRHADEESIVNAIANYRDSIVLFHYRGYVSGQTLLQGQEAGLAEALGDAKTLRLVFLSGDATYNQVASLFDKGIPIVIASNYAINDTNGIEFTVSFYDELSKVNATIKEAFYYAWNKLRLTNSHRTNPNDNGTAKPWRGLPFEQDNDTSPYNLFVREGYEFLLEDPEWWRIEENKQPLPKTILKPKLFALLVGINNYVLFPELFGCLNDVELIENYVQSRVDFDNKLLRLTDRQATRQAIIDAFRNQLSQATSSDTLLFYFAGYGAREAAEALWQETDDALDCIMCYDGGATQSADFLLTDKEFRFLIHELSEKTRAHIVTIFDCSFPTQNTRNGALIAASYTDVQERGIANGTSMDFPQRKWDEFVFSESISHSSAQATIPDEFLPQGKYVQISACASDQIAVEIGGEGVFTKTLIKTLVDNGSNISYRNLMDHVRQYMKASYEQTPELSIPIDSEILANSGFLRRTVDMRKVIFEAAYSNYQGWQLNVGAIHGLKVNSKITLVDPVRPDKVYKAVIRPRGIFMDYAHIDVEELDTNQIYKAEVPGLTSHEFKLELRNHDGNPSEIQKIVNALQRASVYCSFSNGKDADYTLHFRSGEAYFTFPDSPFQPLIRPIEIKDSNSKYLVDAFQHISRWHFIKNLQNEDKFTDIPDHPLAIELTRIWADGTSESINIINDTVELEYEKVGNDWKGTIQIKITNTSNQDLYVCVAYLSKEFACFLDFLRQRVQLLKPGQSIFLSPNGKDKILLKLGQVEQEYNWLQSDDSLKFILSPREFEANALVLDDIPTPLTIVDKKEYGYADKSLSRGMDMGSHEAIQFFFHGGLTQTIHLVFKNPLYNQVLPETVRALMEWEETSYFATGLYKTSPHGIAAAEESSTSSETAIQESSDFENEPKGLFNGIGIAFANKVETLQRRRRYKKLKEDRSRLRIVAVGDSWFQYPFILKDVVERLYKNYAICCLAKAGNKLENYQKNKDYLDIIGEEDARFMLICPGLNNLLLVELPSFLKITPDPSDTTSKRYLNQKFFEALQIVSNQFDAMFTELLDRYPDLNILMHCYDYFIPIDFNDPVNRNKPSWCGRHMINKKINSQIERENLMRYIIDSLTEKLSELIHREKFNNKVTLVDTRGLVPRTEWYDELHPTNDGFQTVADAFIKEIERIRSQQNMN